MRARAASPGARGALGGTEGPRVAAREEPRGDEARRGRWSRGADLFPRRTGRPAPREVENFIGQTAATARPVEARVLRQPTAGATDGAQEDEGAQGQVVSYDLSTVLRAARHNPGPGPPRPAPAGSSRLIGHLVAEPAAPRPPLALSLRPPPRRARRRSTMLGQTAVARPTWDDLRPACPSDPADAGLLRRRAMDAAPVAGSRRRRLLQLRGGPDARGSEPSSRWFDERLLDLMRTVSGQLRGDRRGGGNSATGRRGAAASENVANSYLLGAGGRGGGDLYRRLLDGADLGARPSSSSFLTDGLRGGW